MHNLELGQRRRHVAVFGGNGFIGSHFVDKLVEWGHEVTVMDRFSTAKERYGQRAAAAVRTVRGDYSDPEAVVRGIDGAEIVYNFVSAHTPITSWNSPLDSVHRDIVPALHFLERCAECGVPKVVYISSGGTIYGPQSGILTEETLPQPFNPHGVCKLAVEHFMSHYRTRYGLAADVYRIGNVFGPRQPQDKPQGVIGVWIKRILDGEPLDVFGDQSVRRDYVYVLDVVHLLGHSLRELDSSDTYNIGTGVPVSIIKLLDIFKAVVDKPFEYRIHPRRPSDNISAVLSGAKLLKHYPDFTFSDLSAMIALTWAHVRGGGGE